VRYPWKLGFAVLLLAGGVLAGGRHAPDGGPYAGTWKVTAVLPGQEVTLCLLKVGGDEDNPTAEVLAAPAFTGCEVEDVRAAGGALRFRLKTDRGTYQIAAYAPKKDDDGKVARLFGCFRGLSAYELVHLDRTGLRELDPKKAAVPPPGFAALKKAEAKRDRTEREEDIREVLKKYASEAVTQSALLALLKSQIEGGASVEELKETAGRFASASAVYGREVEAQESARLARALCQLAGERGGALAPVYGRRAAKLLARDDPPELAVDVYRALARALRAAGQGGDAKEADGRVAALNARLDEAFAKNSVPFHPAPPAGRRTGNERVVLVELFTGAQSPPCVGADVAFGAALQVYKPSQVVFLQYHEHIPKPDPLTSPASEARLAYYEKEVQGTPAYVIDGKLLDESIGGPVEQGEKSYSLLRTGLDRAMDAPAGAGLKLTISREGNVVEVTAEVSDLRRPDEQTRLRFVLAEEVVRYGAANGQRLHHHVVRDFPGGAAGFALLDNTDRKTVTFDLGRVHKQLREYLTGVDKRQQFPEDEWPLDLRRLKVIAFIQTDVTKNVFQAAQVDVPEANRP
jgi:hypothetical protein